MYRRYLNVPFARDLDDLQKEMNRLLSSYVPNKTRTPAGYPAMNIYANEEEAVVTAEIPGVSLEDLDIAVVNETLTLKGERQQDELPEGACCFRQERGNGTFTRSFELPFKINANNVEAVFNKGVLKLTLPRAEEDKPKKITVKAG